jgi:hypothetical protein
MSDKVVIELSVTGETPTRREVLEIIRACHHTSGQSSDGSGPR